MRGVTLEERQCPVACRGLPQRTARLLPKPVKRKEEASVQFFLYSSFNEEILSFIASMQQLPFFANLKQLSVFVTTKP